jgi:phage shock protein A
MRELDNVRNQIATAENKFAVNAARIKACAIKKTLNESRAQIAKGVSGLGTLNEMNVVADRMEAEAEATDELTPPSIEDLDTAADKLTASNSADRYLQS